MNALPAVAETYTKHNIYTSTPAGARAYFTWKNLFTWYLLNQFEIVLKTNIEVVSYLY